MAQPSPSRAATLSDGDLADHLTALRDDPALWRSALGSAVLSEARVRFARLAIACGLDGDDGASFAWAYWTQEMTDAQLGSQRDDLWKFTGGVIRNHMSREGLASSRLVSTRAIRQVAVVGMEAPIRFNSAEPLARVRARDLTIDPFGDEREEEAPQRPTAKLQAIAAIKQLLVLAGLTPSQRDLILDEITRHVTTSPNIPAAAEAMRKCPTPSVPLTSDRWQALSALVLGTAKGSPGLIHLIGTGHPSPMNEPHIRKLLPIFLRQPNLSAAGVA